MNETPPKLHVPEEAERALRESEERRRAFIANSSEGIWRFELEAPVSTDISEDEQIELFYRDGYLAECNDAMARMYGFERADEMVGARLGDFLIRSDSNNVEHLRSFIRSGYRLSDAVSVEVDREGRRRRFMNNLVGAVEGGLLLRAWGTQRDVTAVNEAEDELRRGEEKYLSLLENANDIIYSHDLKGNYLTINRAGSEITGYTREEILGGLNIAQVIAPEHLELAKRMTMLKLRDPSPTVYELDIIALDGRRLTLEVSTRIAYRDGEPVAVEGIARDVTDRKRSEEALALSEQRLALAQEAGGIGTFDFDARTRRVIWTPQLESIFGLPPGGFGGTHEHWRELVHPEDFARCESEIQEALASGSREWSAEYRMLRADTGEMRWIDARMRIFYNTAGEPVRMVGVNLDVTERKHAEAERERLLSGASEARDQAEEALRQRRDVEGRLRTLVDASESLLGSPQTDMVLPAVLDLSRRLISADAYAIWRFSPRDSNWSQVASSGLSEEYARETIVVTSQTPRLPESAVIAEDVFSDPLLASRSEMYRREGIRSMLTLPLRAHGEDVGTLVFYYREPRRFDETDVVVATALANLAASAVRTAELYDEQRRMRREAEDAERRASFLAEATTLLSSSLNYEKTLEAVALSAVPQVADWCGVDIVGDGGEVRRLAVAHVDPAKAEWARELGERYPYEPEAPRGVPAVLRTGRSELYEEIPDALLVAAAKDEEHLRILRGLGFSAVMIVPLAAHGRTFGAITFVTAESGRRYGAEDLAFAEDLARRASLAVENARLYGQAQEANRIKDEFLATLSHELRTPLTAILGWATILRTSNFDEGATRRAIETIERNARAQKQIVEDVLDVSRIITGKLRLELRPVELRPLLQDAVETIRPAAEAKGVYLSTLLSSDVGIVSADPDRLQQVLWNLLSNAVKFTARGGRVEVELRREGSQAVVRMSDTGKGISPDFLPHVFDRFRQQDMGTTRQHGGLGLGLAIVRHLTELHGGEVTAESGGQGLGSSFTLRLPLKSVTQAEAGAESAASTESAHANGVESGHAEHSSPLAGMRVLLVEDEEDARVMVKAILESGGAKVIAVSTAAEALETLEAAGCDVLVSDIGMPGEDGYALIRRVRERDALRGVTTPAVALTAYARDEDRTRSLAAGFVAHLPKPVEPSELLSVVAKLARRE
jgi:PAS domain S-box-containing protein